MNCRHCQHSLTNVFLDLGYMPPSNAYLKEANLNEPEDVFPLRLFVCQQCWLVQTEDMTDADALFTEDYAYFSSVSQSWLRHASDYADMITARLNLDDKHFVVEIAANDGYLLKNFISKGIPCLGIEPTLSTAVVAEKLGIRILKAFFGLSLAQQLRETHPPADLIIGNNVFAHVPDINDFTAGMHALLAEEGTITLEFPHLMRLLEFKQFDTVYHEHFSYLSLTAVGHIFDRAGLRIYDVEVLTTHGGSLRVYGCHKGSSKVTSPSVATVLSEEKAMGLLSVATYENFQRQVEDISVVLKQFLQQQQAAGKRVVGYGAAAKGNTLLNHAGIDSELLAVVVDAALSKQGKFLPGSHIPILSPDEIDRLKPDFLLILPWNIASEIVEQQAHIRAWGGQFVTAIPRLEIF